MAERDAYFSASMQLKELTPGRLAAIQTDLMQRFPVKDYPAVADPTVYLMILVAPNITLDQYNQLNINKDITVNGNSYQYAGGKGKPPGSDSFR